MYNEKKELEEFEVERKVLQYKNDSYQKDLAELLTIDDFGSEIKKTLKNPIKITRFKLFKIKLNNFIKSIFDVL